MTPGSAIQVNVGCMPAGGAPQTGGFNGGANAGDAGGSSGAHLGAYNGGGGASDIRIGDCAATLNCTNAARVVVAGGAVVAKLAPAKRTEVVRAARHSGRRRQRPLDRSWRSRQGRLCVRRWCWRQDGRVQRRDQRLGRHRR